MKINYKPNKRLATLSWLAEVQLENVTVYCGENVETHDNFFVEGAWGGTS